MPVDTPVHAAPAENHPKVDAVPEPVREVPRQVFDTGTIERVLGALEPTDHTTSFEHEPTTPLPLLRAEPLVPGGKRRAVKRAAGRGPFVKGFLSAPVLVGIAALAVSVGGVLTVDDASPASVLTASDSHVAASALGGASGVGHFSARNPVVTRGGGRDAQASGTSGQDQLQAAAQGAADERSQALRGINGKADSHDKYLAKNLWVYPLEPVILTARFGDYGLWSSMHTGLDFNGNTGDQIHAIANGVVVSAAYDGSYGNKTVVRLSDGTELWYCHQSAFMVSPGDTVHQGEVIGLVGATGHVTGSHLHVEVHPGGGDPVDPYTAMQQHGLFLGSAAQ
ncbi:MAG TPA: M23 family metallopeptidase [Nocardioides sp.]|uniref:M23 family metallopeptidase n=1 Tax=Nocardioides sp. TaxID=35761 RepID=UPI002E36FC5B|nr:M23 family metallopeptidase [Nocardioides sp.]HEX5090379.1 M23 family metallopeptidase [Nocardioides sp.]